MSQIRAKCEKLLDAYRAKGVDPSSDLLPSASNHELAEAQSWFGTPFPPPLLELYAWHNGQVNGAWDTESDRILEFPQFSGQFA